MLSSSFLPVVTVALAMVAVRAFHFSLPCGLSWYSGLLCTVTAFLAICLVIRAEQIPGDLATFRNCYRQQLRGKVALAAANLVNLPEYRGIYPSWSDPEGFRRIGAFITETAGFPPQWDDGFIQKLASIAVNPQEAGGYIDDFALQNGKLSLRGWACWRSSESVFF